ncbi:hypothetical protein F5Y12DRAFT_737774, partial [Xylaria sp. FL1777]
MYLLRDILLIIWSTLGANYPYTICTYLAGRYSCNYTTDSRCFIFALRQVFVTARVFFLFQSFLFPRNHVVYLYPVYLSSLDFLI